MLKNRTNNIVVRVTDTEKAKIEKIADDNDLNVSNYIRKCLKLKYW